MMWTNLQDMDLKIILIFKSMVSDLAIRKNYKNPILNIFGKLSNWDQIKYT